MLVPIAKSILGQCMMNKTYSIKFKWCLVGSLASVKPTGCPGVKAKLALKVLTHSQHTYYPANDGITALTHHVATCKRWEDGNRLSSEKKGTLQAKAAAAREEESKSEKKRWRWT